MNFKTFVENTSTKRESLTKIQQMTGKKFVEFLSSLKHYIKNGKLNLSKLNVTEKIDGQAVRIAYIDNQIAVEAAYSGLKYKPSEFSGPFMKPFSELLSHLQKNHQKDFDTIGKKYGDFKVVGELLYTNGAPIDSDETITIIATKYNPNKLGKFSTIVVFGEMEFINNEFTPLNTNYIRKELSKISNKDLSFMTTDTIGWSGDIELEYTIDNNIISDVFKNPEKLLKNRELLKTIQSEFTDVFERVVQSRGSVFGIPSSVVEGIVMDIPNFGKVGAANTNWTKLKKRIFRHSTELDELKKEFSVNITGWKVKKKILQEIVNDRKNTEKLFNKHLPKFKKDIKNLEKKYNKDREDIPLNVIRVQSENFDNEFSSAKKLKDINTYIKYLNKEL